ncbi:MAG TPA: FAD-binding and (Fe-S)-binding domain-containing protein [Coriobacteriia bacterium]|nr:FAD-binding and (Fe-S)-binding domain-containing protein [Coriobacteriia bacterium]
MPEVSTRVADALRGIVGEERVRTDRVERKMYSFDIGAMPQLVKPFVPAGVAGAVVRPKTEEQLVELVKFAVSERVSLVPRSWATSGYGGILPPEGAVVVDLSGMTQVLSVDPEHMTVRVQGGAIWEQIDRHISALGLTLRLYPSSYPSSSAAGWLAQGGSGFGSYEYGQFKDVVTAARVVLPNGVVREFTGEELLNYIADAEGTTGFITEVEFRVRVLEPETHKVVGFPSASALGEALGEISRQKVPLWSITFLNPESTKLKKQLPHRHGHPYEEAHPHFTPEIPEQYLAVIAYPSSRGVHVDEALAAIVAAAGGHELDANAAEHEWEQRFAPMRLKRIGPSIVPTEVVVPLAEMPDVLAEIDAKINQPFILEGMVGRGDKVVLLGFIPHDERSFNFNLAFALSLSVIKIAKAHGGAAYSTGLYFRREAASVLGAERLAQLRTFKSEVDPTGVLNPGKVFGTGGVLDLIMGMAAAFEPLVRPIANAATPPDGPGDLSRDINGIPGEVAFMSYACARCGYCVPTCEQYSGRGWESHSPRGKYAYLREVIAGREKFDRKAIDTFLVCTTCEVCNTRCQLQLPIEHNWMEMRGKLIHEEKRGTFPPFEMMAASLKGENDIWAGKRENRDAWVPDDVAARIPEQSDILYFAGCTASYVETDIAEASIRLLQDSGYSVGYMGKDEACCGIPMKVSGKWDVFEEIYEHNVAEARRRGAKTIVTSCPACGLVWKEMYAKIAADRGESFEFEVKHYSELVAEGIAEGKLKLEKNPFEGKTVTFHDSCHAGRAQGLYEPPRDMLKAIPGLDYVEMEHNREEGLCCGSVLTLIGEKPVAPVLGGHRLQEAVDAGADTVVALCPCCQVQLRDSNDKNGLGLRVDDLSRVVAEAAGYDIAESTEFSLYMWSFFDKFIDLMKPEQMARFMTRIFPQMMDAMPAGMKPMMLSMKHVPGGLAMMEKMMPLMFPAMAPGILGKVMPDMVREVEDYIGEMPADMADLMPDLLPKTMDSLMPTYLPELIPHLVPLFIGYLADTEGARPAL